ncbi:MSC_0621 family F1-like ATPase epsilon subunit [Mycoplasmopsis iners]|uniref:MSC_0621 family F1-like ATPase epsilon subunit n=1 Tax=Mycoplasmopsis iners TaxID=76630 RepID=UPI0004985F3C|nr:hypothetical protein [Mycoplasmopsis iners]
MKKLILISSKMNKKTTNIKTFKVNEQLKDEWIKIEDFTLASFKNVLISFTTQNNEEYFALVDSLLIQSKDQEINLYYNEYFETFIQKQDKNQLKILETKYKEVISRIKKMKLLKMVNWNTLNETELEILEKQAFKLKAQIYFSLFNKELVWD